jgi:putative ABC transport system permease protein
MKVPTVQLQQWKQEPTGAIIGDALAKKLGWKIGDRVTLLGTIYPGDWEFKISGIYEATRKSVDRSSFMFHWNNLNESVPERTRDQVGWTIARVQNSNDVARISTAIDRMFEDQEVQTLSMSERALNMSFLASFSAILKAIDIVSAVILFIMMLILGNTIAMGVRERTNEYGVLRAIGFLPKHLGFFVIGEAITTGTLGAALGLLLAYPFIERGMGRWIEENMGSIFPYFRISPTTAITAFILAVVLSIVAAAIPAVQAYRINVVTALRRVG